MNFINSKTGKSMSIEEALIFSGQQAYTIKPKKSWLIRVGGLLKYIYNRKYGEVLYTFKWNSKNNQIDVYDADGKQIKSIGGETPKTSISSDVQNSTSKKISRSSK